MFHIYKNLPFIPEELWTALSQVDEGLEGRVIVLLLDGLHGDGKDGQEELCQVTVNISIFFMKKKKVNRGL